MSKKSKKPSKKVVYERLLKGAKKAVVSLEKKLGKRR